MTVTAAIVKQYRSNLMMQTLVNHPKVEHDRPECTKCFVNVAIDLKSCTYTKFSHTHGDILEDFSNFLKHYKSFMMIYMLIV